MTQQTNYPNKMMSAVEWLCNELHKYINGESNFTGVEIREQAKQMEKEQIFDAYSWGECNIDNYGCKIEKNGAEQYYNEKYDRATNPNQDH